MSNVVQLETLEDSELGPAIRCDYAMRELACAFAMLGDVPSVITETERANDPNYAKDWYAAAQRFVAAFKEFEKTGPVT